MVACVKSLYDPSERNGLATLGKAADWAELTALARRHRVEGLVWPALGTAGFDPGMPALASLAAAARATSQEGLRAAAESSRLQAAFNSAGIDLLFLKGLAVGHLAYGNAFIKRSWDIDVLVAPDAIGAAAELLGRAGYRRDAPGEQVELVGWHSANKESVWQSADGLHHVELHSRLADNDRIIPSVGMGSPRQNVAVATGIVLPTLATDELFAYLCVHGASSAWFRLKWVADLAGVLRECSPMEVHRLYRRSQELGAGRSAAQALMVVDALFGLALPTALRAEMERSAANRLLALLALRELAAPRAPTERRLGTAAIHLSQLLLYPGAAFAWQELRRQLGAAVANRRPH